MLVLTSSAFAQRIAIFDFNAGTGVAQVEVDGLSAIFNTYFSPKGAQIIERTRVDRLLQEHKFQKSKFTTTDMVAMGEQLNASLIVVGDVNIVMEQYNVDIRVVNVQTGTVVAKGGDSWSKQDLYRDKMKGIAEKISAQIEAAPKVEEKEVPEDMITEITEDNGKRVRTDVVVLHGYLKLYPKDLGEYKNTPYTLIRKINDSISYGYDSWRLPTEEELDIIRSNRYLSGLKYMTQSDPRGVLLLVTTKNPVVHKSKLPIAKQDISLHGGAGLSMWSQLWEGFLIGLKYKYKPFDKYNIRLLGEIGTAFTFATNESGLSILPIMAGINYEYRFTESTSVWTDVALGISIPLSNTRNTSWGEYVTTNYDRIEWRSGNFTSFETGFALSPEIGVRYNDFSFSFKGIFSLNDCYAPFNQGGIYGYGSFYFLFQLGYHF